MRRGHRPTAYIRCVASISGAGPIARIATWAHRTPLTADLAVAVLLATTAGTVSVITVLADPPPAGMLALTLTGFFLMHAAVVGRRRMPAAAFVVAALGETLLALVPLQDAAVGASYPVTLLPSGLAYLLCAYSVSAAGPGSWPRISLIVGLVGSAAVTVRFSTGAGFADTAPGGGVGGTLFAASALSATVTAVWGLGTYRRWRAGRFEAMAERAERAEADHARSVEQAALEERRRIAREMHDVVAHSLTVVVRQAEGGRFTSGDPSAAALFSVIADTGREALRDMRSLLGVLGSDSDPDGRRPQPTMDDLAPMIDRLGRTGLIATLETTGDPRPVDRAIHLAAYRLVQESLTNVAKHAGSGARAAVRVRWSDDTLLLTISDDGVPPPPTVPAPTAGRGHTGMAERLASVGGSLDVGPDPGGGYRVAASIPLRGSRIDAEARRW